jgi:glutathione S-transferase
MGSIAVAYFPSWQKKGSPQVDDLTMPYRLFYADRSAAMGVRVILEEIGEAYDLIETEIGVGMPRAPELLALNPNGWVPVLVWEHGAIYECAAIVIFLCDRNPQCQLAPSVDHPDRGRFLQWLFFFSSSLQTAYQMTYYADRFCASKEDEDTVQRRSIKRLRELWQVIDNAIGDGEWMLGQKFSAADIYLFMLTTWLSEERDHPSVEEFPNVSRVANAVLKRPAVQKVYQPLS